MKMPIYYVICYKKIEKCYLVKEGYIPCRDYRLAINDFYYSVYSRELFCLPVDTKKDVFENLEEAKQKCKERLEETFKNDLIHLIDVRNNDLKIIEELK